MNESIASAYPLEERLVTIDLNKLRPEPRQLEMSKWIAGFFGLAFVLAVSGSLLGKESFRHYTHYQWHDWHLIVIAVLAAFGFWCGYQYTTPIQMAHEILSETGKKDYEVHIRNAIAEIGRRHIALILWFTSSLLLLQH